VDLSTIGAELVDRVNYMSVSGSEEHGRGTFCHKMRKILLAS